MRYFYCLVDCQSLVITFLGICELLIKGSSFTFRSLPAARALRSFPSHPSRASRLFYAPHSTSFPGSSLAHPWCKRGPGKRGWLPTKPLACVAGAWKQWAQERTGPREGDTREEMEQRRFWAQHSVAMLEQCCNHSKQCRNNVATLCYAMIVVANRLV